ncbi:MAG: 30S ribosomal protein S3 [Anaerolineales bacterium]|nr:30S ribosomal protein S3 [Anaerolineales bacterium]MCX7755579.1 30S ribosomal protein S3 [Anaerolineales bacterium]MDW8278382.1 30S ribosomal protein S3 [Anaerolineales bacterium]
MGRKVHPVGFRLSVNRGWQGRWFAEGSQYREQLQQDFAIRNLVQEISPKAGVSRVEVERFSNKVKVTVHTAKPGILIGRKGEGAQKVRKGLQELVGKKIDLDIKEISAPDADAYLIARNIADQLQRRIAYRRAMKKAIQSAMRQGAQGIKIEVAGRLAGAEMARSVWLREGRVPLQTLRADIDFSRAEALTTYGRIGIKVWVYKGEMKQEVEEKAESTEGVYVSE